MAGFLWLHAISDSTIALAYFSIAVTLLYFVKQRKDLGISALLLMSGAFIMACGATHLMAVWDLWHGASRLQGLTKAITAALSIATAIAAVRVLPTARRIATAEHMERINAALQAEIESRKQVEQQLNALIKRERTLSETRLGSYFEAAAQGILALGPDGTIQLVNRRAEEMFGYGREDLMGQKLSMLLPDRSSGFQAERRAAYFADPRVHSISSGLELVGLRKDGSEFPAEIALSYTETEDGTFGLGLVSDITERTRIADELVEANAGLIADIAERKRVESELARVNTELARSNSELAQFAYVASHDLQEPLRMITGYLQLLERRYKGQLNAEASEFIGYAVDGATRMKNLIQDLLRLSRAGTQSINFREIEVRAVVDAACANLEVALEECGAVLTIDPLPMVVADAGLLTQVFQNLIGNGIKFHAPGGSARSKAPSIHVSAQPQAEGWMFSVRDDGIGIEPKHFERIFGIFERLHGMDEYDGSGVGLAITQRIVERHGGRVWVESTLGEGATFFFSIPEIRPN